MKNAFRMLCKQSTDKDNFIHRDRIKKILEEIGIDDIEIAMLIGQLDQDFNKEGFLNFDEFVDRQYI